jgi:hypothetical protein
MVEEYEVKGDLAELNIKLKDNRDKLSSIPTPAPPKKKTFVQPAFLRTILLTSLVNLIKYNKMV